MRAAAVAAVCVVLIGCAKESAPRTTRTPSPTGTQRLTGTGIQGKVTAGPACPVQRVDQPCPDKPVDQATVTVMGTTEQTTSTDARGVFSMRLPPGAYDVTAVPEGPAGGAADCDLKHVSVYEGVYTQVRISCDTGIR